MADTQEPQIGKDKEVSDPNPARLLGGLFLPFRRPIMEAS